MPYITRILGKDALGINSFGQAIVGYFVLLGNLGITIYGAKAIAERRDDKNSKQQKFAECITYQFFFNVIAILLYNSWVIFQGDYIYFLFNIIILTSMTDLSWAYTGMERFDLIAVRNLVIKIVGTLMIFIFVKKETDLALYIVIQQGVLLISNVVFWFELSKIDLKPFFSSISQALRNVLKPALLLFIPSIFTSIYLSLNRVMLGYMSTIGEVAIYDYPNRLVRIAITFIGILGTVLMPRLAYLNSNGNKEEYILKTKQLLFGSILCSVPVMYLLIMLATPLCTLFFTEEFKAADYVMTLVAPTVITSGLSLYLVFVSLDRVNTLTYSVATGSIINIILNLCMLSTWGARGAAVSTIITEILVHCILVYYLRTIIPIKWLLNKIVKFVIYGAIPFFIFKTSFFATSIFPMICISIGYICIYLILILTFEKKKLREVFFSLRTK